MPPRKTTTAKKTTPAKAVPAKKAAAAKNFVAEEVAINAGVVAAMAGTDQFAAFLLDLRTLVDSYLTPIGTVSPAPAVPVADATDDTDTDAGANMTRSDREGALSGLTVRALQNILIAAGYDEDDVKPEKDKQVLITNILDEEFGDDAASDDEDADEEEQDEDEAASDEEDADDEEDEEDEDSDEEDEDEEEEELDRDDLIALSLNELKKLAVNTYGLDASTLKGKDKDTIADMILESGAEEDEDEEEGDEEEEFYTVEDLTPMPIKEVRAIADEAGLTYTAAQAKSKSALIKLITE